MVRYSVISNSLTDQYLVIDNYKIRYNRMRARIWSWADNVKDLDGKLYVFLLTYDRKGTLVKPSSWSPNHIRDFMKEYKRRLDKNLIAYAWVSELFRSGDPQSYSKIFWI